MLGDVEHKDWDRGSYLCDTRLKSKYRFTSHTDYLKFLSGIFWVSECFTRSKILLTRNKSYNRVRIGRSSKIIERYQVIRRRFPASGLHEVGDRWFTSVRKDSITFSCRGYRVLSFRSLRPPSAHRRCWQNQDFPNPRHASLPHAWLSDRERMGLGIGCFLKKFSINKASCDHWSSF